jgi:membrane-bound ClpP family serine protease
MAVRNRVLEVLTDPRLEPALYLAGLLLLLAVTGLLFAALGL